MSKEALDPVRHLRAERERYESMKKVHDMVGNLQGADETIAAFKYMDGLIKLLKTENEALYRHIEDQNKRVEQLGAAVTEVSGTAQSYLDTIQGAKEIFLVAMGKDRKSDVDFSVVVKEAAERLMRGERLIASIGVPRKMGGKS